MLQVGGLTSSSGPFRALQFSHMPHLQEITSMAAASFCSTSNMSIHGSLTKILQSIISKTCMKERVNGLDFHSATRLFRACIAVSIRNTNSKIKAANGNTNHAHLTVANYL